MIENFYQHKEKILKKSQEFFLNSNSLIPKIGCELEFFLLEENAKTPANEAALMNFLSDLKKFYNCEKEQGKSQIEIKTDYTSDLLKLCRELKSCKKYIRNLAAEKKLAVSFAAQPFLEDCGNALQFNVSLHDENDKNIFAEDENILKNCAANLLTSTDSMMIFLAPNQEDYARFSNDLNHNLFKNGKYTAPTNLSFGHDNRTCAIRVPTITEEKPNKRLEYRPASASADPWLCVAAILLALSNKSTSQFEQIFGNAFEPQYKLKEFCKKLEEAEDNFFKKENFIRNKMVEFSA